MEKGTKCTALEKSVYGECGIGTGGARTGVNLPGESIWLQVSGSGTVGKGKLESSGYRPGSYGQAR